MSSEALIGAEQTIVRSGSPLGIALDELLRSAGPIRDSALNLGAWLHTLDRECSLPPPAPTTSPPTDPATLSLSPEYSATFLDTFGPDISAHEAVSAFANGSLASVVTDASDCEAIDEYIRAHPPQWTTQSGDIISGREPDGSIGGQLDDTATGPDPAFAQVCAELYLALRSGFDVLPPGTVAETPTETPNYRSVEENVDDVREEIARLRRLGHLIAWSTAQQRHPELRGKRRPDHVLALGAVVKRRLDGVKKTRLVIDPSRAVARAPPHAEVPGLNDDIPLPNCRLPTVRQASRAMYPRCYFFVADIVDAYLNTKHSIDSLRLMGVVFDDILMVYDSLCFGLKSAPAHQQRLATVFTRLVMRRWSEAGIDIGAVPGADLYQAYPCPGDRKRYLFAFLDDFFGIGFATKAEADTAYGIFCKTADELGLPLQYAANKVVPPCTKTTFLGVVFCSRTNTLSLSEERIAKMKADLDALDMSDTVSVAELQKVIGVFMFATVVFSLCRPYLRRMLDLLKSAGPNPSKRLRLQFTAAARDDIAMWRRILGVLRLNCRPVYSLPLRRRTIKAELFTDASYVGGSYFIGGLWRCWRWGPDIRARIGASDDDGVFICELEALALLQAIRDLAPLFVGRRGRGGQTLICHVDNDPVVRMIAKHSSRSSACAPILRELTGLLLAYGLELSPTWIASADNEIADQLSRTDEISATELLSTLRRWTAAHPDITAWSPGAPVRPELLASFDRHPFEPRGSLNRGVAPAASDLASGICIACGSDPCECDAVSSHHRVWTRPDGPHGAGPGTSQ